MKYAILAVFGAGLILGSAYYVGRAKTVHPAIVHEQSAEAVTQVADSDMTPRHAAERIPAQSAPAPANSNEPAVAAVPMPQDAVAQAVEVLVAPDATHEQKQSVWKQLREGRGLDGAIAELQRRFAANPSSPENAAVLGQACLQKCATITDLRDQGMLAMQADKLFDTALNLDPQNWEARFTKAVAMSYWPASMGKSEEVIQQFLLLVQQQETHPAQPQFAETYVWLGDQYQKAGRNEDARSVWGRGSALYPTDQKLGARLEAVR